MNSFRKTLVASFIAAEAVLLTGCGSAALPEQRTADVARAVVSLTDHPEAVAALRDSSYLLGARMLAVEPDKNQVTSPVSALAALAMLRVGARTTTAEEMDRVLGLPAEHRDEAMNALLAAWAEYDGDPASVDDDDPPEEPLLHLANGLFPAEDLVLGDAFLEPLAAHYGTGVYPVDYGSDAALESLNGWVAHHTGGRVDEVPIEPTVDTVLNIINSVYFAAAWAEPFDPSLTEPDTFTTASGPVEASMMHTQLPLAYAEGDGWQGIDLPYNNGFVMRLILPAEGVEPVLDQAAMAEFNAAMQDAPSAVVGLSLPAWDHTHNIDLKEMLTLMGLEEAMGPAPDFSGISPRGLFVEGAAQSANITVAEKGTIAAAVTQISMSESGFAEPDVALAFDRPFLYQILHQETGMPVFLGTVMDPSKS